MANLQGASTTSNPQGTVQRFLAILNELTVHENGISVRNLAEKTQGSRSAVHRVLQAFAEEGYAEQREEGRYVVGPKLFAVASQVYGNIPIMRIADGVMKELVEELGETSYLASFDPEIQQAIFVHRVETDSPIRHVQKLGSRRPLHAGAVGKAILSVIENFDFDQLDLTRFTPTTSIDIESLKKQVEITRSRGYAITKGERVPGVIGIAAPLVVEGEAVGGLTIAIPNDRVTDSKLPSMGEIVKEHADKISRAMDALGIKSF